MTKRTWSRAACAFILTVTVLLVPFGCLKAELSTRAMLGTPLTVDAVALHRRVDETVDTLCETLPPRLALPLLLLRAELTLMERWI